MSLFYLYATAKSEIRICSNKHETGLVVTETSRQGSLAIILFRVQITKALASLREYAGWPVPLLLA